MKYCLGIESTAHTFGASIVSFDGNVLSNVRKLFSTEEGGLIPVKVADHHVEFCDDLIRHALAVANLSIKDISLIAFSQSPGIGHTLRVGAAAARSLSLVNDLPLIGVNHCIAHLEIGRLKAVCNSQPDVPCNDPILLYASGANTQVIGYEGKKYRVFGETLDIGVGNFIDSFARALDLGFPGGPKIEQLAKQSTMFIDLPYSVKGMDVSFGGMLTKLERMIKSGDYSKEDLCFSVQEIAFAMLLEVSERALAHTGKTQLVLGGGVACNKRLQEMAAKMCVDRGALCFVLPNEFNVDNAAMIAWTGVLQYNSGQQTEVSKANINPYLRTDEVNITWRD